jgi:hypothetical protein
MEQEFIPYEQALALKELGFDEPCFGYYISLGDNKENPFKLIEIQSEKGQFEWTDNVYYAPLYQQAFRWFRDKHELSSWVYNSYMDKYFYTILQNGRIVKANESVTTYEKAELACLIKLIEIVKNK